MANSSNKGLFITFEGVEGSGKTTITRELTKILSSKLRQKQYPYSNVLLTREPGGNGSKVSEQIRDFILTNDNIPLIAEAFLFLASRACHVEDVIQPSMDKNEIILCDRYIDSTIVYQWYVNSIDLDLFKLNEVATNNLMPHITFYLRLDDYKIGLNRISANQRETNRFDKVTIENHMLIAESYDIWFNLLKQYDKSGRKIFVIDASKPIQEVVQECLDKIDEYLKQKEHHYVN